MKHLGDYVDGRGPWMQTSMGGQFFPADPDLNEMFAYDIANGLAAEGRYGGQVPVEQGHYSVAEHSVLVSQALSDAGYGPDIQLLGLLHDGAEAYVKDIHKGLKVLVRDSYQPIEYAVQSCIWQKYHLAGLALTRGYLVKDFDTRIVPAEKQALFSHARYEWKADQIANALDVSIYSWPAVRAKTIFLGRLRSLCSALKMNLEGEPYNA